MIFKDVLGGFEVVMLGNHADVWNLDDSDRQDGITDAFALLRVCRQTYAETAALPYALNTFVAICRVEREIFAAARNFGQLEAIQTVHMRNPYLIDAINRTDFGGCSAGGCTNSRCRDLTRIGYNYQHPSVPMLAMPFSLLLPNLRKICIDGRGIFSDVVELGELAQRVGMED
jgi:hypothetical protein